jgi:hypothetical protein
MIAVLGGMLLPGRGGADEIKPLPPDEKAFGLTLTEWAIAYFQWHFSLPVTRHPATDKTGVEVPKGQRLPVWFLPWSTGENYTRTITVPAGYGIMVPVASRFYAADGPGTWTDEELLEEWRTAEADWFARLKRIEVSIDGVPIPDLQPYRVQTPLFSLVYPPGNIMNWSATGGKDQRAVAFGAGWFLLFLPLSPGKHVIQSHVETVSPSTGDPINRTHVHNLIIQETNKAIE